MSLPPSMVHRSGNKLVVRSVVSGDKLYGTSEAEEEASMGGGGDGGSVEDAAHLADKRFDDVPSGQPIDCDKGRLLANLVDEELPQCKVKRNYACSSCSYYTQNPRYYLHHLKNVHKEKIRIYECPHCLYASKHSQKLQRHIHMVHVMGKRKLLIKAKGPAPNAPASPCPEEFLAAVEVSQPDDCGSVASGADDHQIELSKEYSDPSPPSRPASPEEPRLSSPPPVDEPFDEGPLKCSLCSFSSRNPNLVTRHERLVHLKKKFYRCTKCDYITHMKARFTKHVKYHSMPMIKCEMCDFRTPYKWNLDRHNKNHFANGAFKCSQCNFTADIKQSLTVHEMNHHVPPVNQNGVAGGAVSTPAKRRCRVGASDVIDREEVVAATTITPIPTPVPPVPTSVTVEPDLDDLELLRMERESLPIMPAELELDSSAMTSDEVAQMAAVEITMLKPNNVASNSGSACKTLNLKNPTAAAYLKGALKPEDVILTKNGSVYVKRFKCRVCPYKAAWESEMIRHEARVHGLDQSKKKPLPRPIPNLIPIQNNGGSKSQETTPTRNGVLPSMAEAGDPERSITEKDLNDLYTKSCSGSSSLKDFASLIGTDEAAQPDRLKESPEISPASKVQRVEAPKLSPDAESKKVALPDSFKKKNASFFDRLKEKLMGGAGENNNLVCWCGHKSKCLSESVLHQKTHSESDKSDKSIQNGPMISGAELSSTRCQHCRHRCKTSSDLFVHLQSCPQMNKKENDLANGSFQPNSVDQLPVNHVDEIPPEEDGEMEDELDDSEKFNENTDSKPPKEEQRVFVWNNFSVDKVEDNDDMADEDSRCRSPAASESSLVGYEIAPGIGSVLPNNNEDNAESYKSSTANIDISSTEGVAKKVFKCPHCSFWASTASRFHVHIVSHMNVKPFACSVCPYQSKWKWDVTKHIKLKKERDPVHETAEIQTVDMETGRRNYTKYNRHLTVMRVHEPHVEVSVAKSSMSNSMTTSTISNSAPSSSVPVLPRLTPAPSMNGDAEKGAATTDVSMRPLPPLHPANPTVGSKRPHDAGDDSEIPKKKLPSEKKMWKCKKCKFRNTDRNVVLAHVKEHYVNGSQNRNDSSRTANDGDSSPALPESTNRMDNQASDRFTPKNLITPEKSTDSILKCDLCNFETSCSSTFRFHESHHVDNPSAPFRCCFCPFYAHEKQFMSEHIASHGVDNVEEALSMTINNRISTNGDEGSESCDDSMTNAADDGTNKSDSVVGDEMEIYKRFKCTSCPYVTNNKSQYLYHKQFHRLRNAPFKCNICSYNVTKRHLLHQHLKIHGVKRAQFKNCIKDAVEREEPDESFALNTDIETSHLPDIPLVWVHKAGALTKMFKCRHCPHVNLRKSNIHEHEKMHFDRVQRSPNGSIASNQMSTHHCTECNYVCNNAGALASHFKVHQGAFGQICALADSRRSDESQIREITRLLKEDERFKNARPLQPSPLEESAEANCADQEMATDLSICEPGSSSPSISSHPATPNSTPNCAAEKRILNFCNTCPARFISPKDLESHSRFHSAHHMFKCNSCTYSAPQQAQWMAHKRVHTNEYQEKTHQMCAIYECSKENPRPRTTLIPEKPGFSSLGWVVVHTGQKKMEDGGAHAAAPKTKVVTKQFACHKCPAMFFKSVALQHHLTLHGGKDQYECRSCDYRVKTYGNLIKHESVHGLEPRQKAKASKAKKLQSPGSGGTAGATCSFPTSGTELFQHRSEQLIKEQISGGATIAPIIMPASLTSDPEFGNLIHGSPDFMYQPTLKNGKMKEKRYKCHKCPSAFEKREQYKKHVSLHGAKSKFKCEKCDYSVSNYANYTQHMRKHDWNERSLLERRASMLSKDADGAVSPLETTDMSAELADRRSSSVSIGGIAHVADMSPEKTPASALSSPPKAAKMLHISVADQQAVVLMQQRLTDNGVNLADQLHRCYYCPYSHQRKDAVETHEKRCHINPKGSFVCDFCNYAVPQPHFLREHQKLHFGFMKGIKPEAYMKCDRLEIWMETENGKVLIFKDSGSSARDEDRFEPKAEPVDDQSTFQKMYVDVKTGEEYIPKSESDVQTEKASESGAKLSAPAPRILPHLRPAVEMPSTNGVLGSPTNSHPLDEDTLAGDLSIKDELETFDEEELADELPYENGINAMDIDDELEDLQMNAAAATAGLDDEAVYMDDDDLEADEGVDSADEMVHENGVANDYADEEDLKSEPEDVKSEPEDVKSESEDVKSEPEEGLAGLTRRNGTKLRIDVAAMTAAALAASSEDSDTNDSESSSSSSSSSSSCSGSCSSSDSSELSSDDEKEEATEVKSEAVDDPNLESMQNDDASVPVTSVNAPQNS